jgi:hypothetical protein
VCRGFKSLLRYQVNILKRQSFGDGRPPGGAFFMSRLLATWICNFNELEGVTGNRGKFPGALLGVRMARVG